MCMSVCACMRVWCVVRACVCGACMRVRCVHGVHACACCVCMLCVLCAVCCVLCAVCSSIFQYIPVYSNDLPVGSLRVMAERKERERPSLPVRD